MNTGGFIVNSKKYAYNVYLVDEIHYDNGVIHKNKTLLRKTSAVSEARAISNVRYTCKIPNANLECSYSTGGYRRSYYVAELA